MNVDSGIGRLAEAEQAYQRSSTTYQRLIDVKLGADPYPAGHAGGHLLKRLGNLQRDWALALTAAGRVADAEKIQRESVKTFDTVHREYLDIAPPGKSSNGQPSPQSDHH